MSLLDRVPGELKLYIGGLFTLRRKSALQDADITHVVSVLRAMPVDLALFSAYKHMVVEVDDVDDENLLEHLPATTQFIHDGLAGGGGVFVHCAMGKSRSATVLLAYLLAHHPDLAPTPDAALALLRQSRPLVEPNTGFMEQLRLWHHMRCPRTSEALAASPPYQRWLYQREVESARSVGKAPGVEWIRFEDEHPVTTTPDDHHHGDEAQAASSRQEEARAVQGVREEVAAGARAGVELKCKKCRRTLARSPFIVPHEPAKYGSAASPPPTGLTIKPHRSDAAASTADESLGSGCAHHFLDPLSWMREELSLGRTEGKLECPNPKCRTLVGKYAWHGLRCSCGGWEVPGISVQKSRVDETRLARGTEGRIDAAAADGLSRIRRGPGVGGNL